MDGIIQESGVTINDFTNPVVFTVIAEDSMMTKYWIVTILAETSSSIDDFKEVALIFSPNPVRDELYIKMERLNGREAILEVYDLYGRKVEWHNIKNEGLTMLNVSDYLPGIYIGVVRLENRELLYKFLKE